MFIYFIIWKDMKKKKKKNLLQYLLKVWFHMLWTLLGLGCDNSGILFFCLSLNFLIFLYIFPSLAVSLYVTFFVTVETLEFSFRFWLTSGFNTPLKISSLPPPLVLCDKSLCIILAHVFSSCFFIEQVILDHCKL